jgi:polysaccharide deacetylase family protein (PEP-CTERM system associated)
MTDKLNSITAISYELQTMSYHILLTIDVEDWFQVENFKQYIPFSSWPSYELRVEKNTHRLLDLLDSITLDNPINPTNSPKATFFVLAWIAERLPLLVREIRNRGHEVASHGYYHNLCKQESKDDLRDDLTDSKKMLEDVIGSQVFGYRAPSFSIDDEILKVIEDCGYLYDSSFNSFGIHKRYGVIALSGNGRKGIAFQISDTFYELPITNIKLKGHILPWGGGGYFRMLPFSVFRMGVQLILEKEKAYVFYIHPWEIDSQQPRVKQAPPVYKFRHYVNLKRSYSKLLKFLWSFNQCNLVSCHQYLEQVVE